MGTDGRLFTTDEPVVSCHCKWWRR